MMQITGKTNQFVWVEKYRPQTIADTILPSATKEMASGYMKQGRIPNLMFTGPAGVGKTTLARAMCEEIGCDYIIVNASNENSVDVLRTKVTQFACTSSFSDAKKVVILDEADNLTPAFQAAFRNAMEEFASNCSFILTCNFPNKIIDPIHSRCGIVNFKITKSDSANLANQFFKRVIAILDNEEVTYDKKVIAEVVQKHFPDFRRTLNELQKYAATGTIDAGILVNMTENAINSLIVCLKNKKFNDMRKWVAENSDIDPTQLFRTLYDVASSKMVAKSVPELILLIGEYQYKSSQVMDQEINTAAFLTEILMSQTIQWS